MLRFHRQITRSRNYFLWSCFGSRAANMLAVVTRERSTSCLLSFLLLNLCVCAEAWPRGDDCPSSEWSAMCRPCCEYHLIQCRCPSKGLQVGYTVPCCRNALDQCDPCIIHPGCSLFENCKTCHNGTWKANDDFFVRGKFCTECRQGWSGGDCKTCGGVIQRAQGHVALESYPTNARCEWTLQAEAESNVELRFSRLSLESDYNCRYDYVEVRDGDGLSSPVIGRFCGDQLPPPIRSSGSALHILFSSDGYNNFDGFVLTFQERSGVISTASTAKNPPCALPEKPANGYLLAIYGPEKELVSVSYRCHPPFTAAGSQQRVCLPNGTWSAAVPTCVKGQTSPARCPPPLKLLNGYHRRAPDTAGGAETFEFFCKKSYILSGNHQSTCLPNGSWSSGAPTCVRACRQPKVSELVRQTVVKPRLTPRYSMPDLLSAGFIPLQSSDRSEDDVELPRGFHPVHTSIEYECSSALYRVSGSSRRTCLKTGRWSGRHVSCKPVCGKFDTFSPLDFADAPWPWHAAVYTRSPPDDTASSPRPRGGSTWSDQQGASEESWFWSLACSGALLSQRRVLVAARCVADKDKQQTLHPAHVKVVVQKQTSKDRLQDLRVSEVVVHPDFYSAAGADVAMLKLKDKMKISERLLPVCLPKGGGEVTAREAYTASWILPDGPASRRRRRRAPSGRTELVELVDVAQCEREFVRGGGGRATRMGDNSLCVIGNPSGLQRPCPRVLPGVTVTMPAESPPTGTGEASSAGWQLLALESFSDKERNCHQRTHRVQTRLSNFGDWIEESMT